MADESPEDEPKHAERVRRSRNRKPSPKLPPDSKYDWPKNLNELVEWYTYEVEDVTRAAQLRIKDATAFVAACANRKISLEEARRQWGTYGSRWGQVEVEQTRGMTDEEIHGAMKRAAEEDRQRRRSR